MALQTAEAAKAGADTNRQIADVSSPVISDIDTEIAIQMLSGKYVAYFDFETTMDGETIRIKQSDSSYIDLDVVLFALENSGYRCTFNKKNITNGIKIKLSLAWN